MTKVTAQIDNETYPFRIQPSIYAEYLLVHLLVYTIMLIHEYFVFFFKKKIDKKKSKDYVCCLETLERGR